MDSSGCTVKMGTALMPFHGIASQLSGFFSQQRLSNAGNYMNK
jgi:hypothetical protein